MMDPTTMMMVLQAQMLANNQNNAQHHHNNSSTHHHLPPPPNHMLLNQQLQHHPNVAYLGHPSMPFNGFYGTTTNLNTTAAMLNSALLNNAMIANPNMNINMNLNLVNTMNMANATANFLNPHHMNLLNNSAHLMNNANLANSSAAAQMMNAANLLNCAGISNNPCNNTHVMNAAAAAQLLHHPRPLPSPPISSSSMGINPVVNTNMLPHANSMGANSPTPLPIMLNTPSNNTMLLSSNATVNKASLSHASPIIVKQEGRHNSTSMMSNNMPNSMPAFSSPTRNNDSSSANVDNLMLKSEEDDLNDDAFASSPNANLSLGQKLWLAREVITKKSTGAELSRNYSISRSVIAKYARLTKKGKVLREKAGRPSMFKDYVINKIKGIIEMNPFVISDEMIRTLVAQEINAA